MELEDALFAHLTEFGGLTDLVSTRVYPVMLPQGVLSDLEAADLGAEKGAITYQVISEADAAPSHSGRSTLCRTRVQMTCWGNRHCVCRSIATQLKVALDGWRGMLGGPDGVKVGRSARVNRVDLGRDPGQRVYRIACDFMLLYEVPR